MIKTAAQLISDAQTRINCLDVESAYDLYQKSEEIVIVDVREASSADKSKLKDSVNISRGLIEMKVPGLVASADAIILTHCGGGGRASLAADTLTQMGYKNVYAITAKYDDIKARFG